MQQSGLQEPACRHADDLAGPDHQVIKDPHAHQAQRGDGLIGDGSIRRARFRVSAGVVMGQDGCHSADGKGHPDDFPGGEGWRRRG